MCAPNDAAPVTSTGHLYVAELGTVLARLTSRPRAVLRPRGTAPHLPTDAPRTLARSGCYLAGWGCPRAHGQCALVLATQALGGGGRVQELSLDGRPLQARRKPPTVGAPCCTPWPRPNAQLRPSPLSRAPARRPACHTRCSSPPRAVLCTACVSSRDRRSKPRSATCFVPRDAR